MIAIGKAAMIGALTITLAACTTADSGQKQTAGTIIGAIGGAVLGSKIGGGSGRVAAAAAGTLLGAWLGSEVGKSLDRADRLAMARAQKTAYTAPIGQRITWENPDSGHAGEIIPTREGVDRETGAYCREFQNKVMIGGKEEVAYGTACRQPDGSWKIVN